MKRLESLPKIRRRLFKLWSLKCRERAGYKCEYCNRGKGDIINGKALIKLDAHHLQTRKIRGNPLKFDLRNSVCVCPLHHKFSCTASFHKSPIVMIAWSMKNFPERFYHVLEHYNDIVNLDNRNVLYAIERYLNNNEPLDVEKLKKISIVY